MFRRRILGVALAVIMLIALIPGTAALAAQVTVNANTVEELLNAIAPNTKIVLSGVRYELPSTLKISNTENLTIEGTTGTKIVDMSHDDPVFWIDSCDNFTLRNVYAGHDELSVSDEGCGLDAIVVCVFRSADVTVENCELYGCGISGFYFQDSSGTFSNTTIRDCSDSIGTAYSSTIEFNDCTFSNNGYLNGNLVAGFSLDSHDYSVIDNNLKLIFNNCSFINNKTSFFKWETSKEDGAEYAYRVSYGAEGYNTGYTQTNNCTFTNNAWEPDDWAAASVSSAVDLGIVPDSISHMGWRNPTTRLAAAEAMVLLLEKTLGKSMQEIASEKGWDLSANHFSDTDNDSVAFLRCANIVDGIGDNKYDPYGTYIRAHIVTMLGKIAEAFFDIKAQGDNPFTDVPDYAAPYVGYAAEVFNIKGVGDGKFDPDSAMQNEGTAMLSLLAYYAWSAPSSDIQ